MKTVLFAGGGTGGHIIPNLAIVERLRERGVAFSPHFLVSDRGVDAKVMAGREIAFTPLTARPLSFHPIKFLGFAASISRGARASALRIMRETRATCVVATGGFVSAPVAIAARQLKIPLALVSLDAVPGKANRLCAPFSSHHFSAYPVVGGKTEEIGPLLLRGVTTTRSAQSARLALGLEALRPTLLVFGGSQGGGTVNEAVLEFARRPVGIQSLQGWQVLHLTGEGKAEEIRKEWAALGIPARVESFLNGLADAWAAASCAVCRAGAGTVGEAWASATPCVFMPYPWHKDQHQKFNAEPLADLGAAHVIHDHREPVRNANELDRTLRPMLSDPGRIAAMRLALESNPPKDGAMAVAKWVESILTPQA